MLLSPSPNAAGETVLGVVGDLDRLLLGVEGDDREDGPKISSRAMVMSLDTPPEHSLQYASDASGPVDVPVLHPNGNATLGDGFSYDP